MLASESIPWNEVLYSISLIRDIKIVSLRMTYFIINFIVNDCYFSFNLGLFKVLQVESLAIIFLWRLFSPNPGSLIVNHILRSKS